MVPEEVVRSGKLVLERGPRIMETRGRHKW